MTNPNWWHKQILRTIVLASVVRHFLFPTHYFSSYLQSVSYLTCKNLRETVIYNLLFSVYKDIAKKNKAPQEVAEIVGIFSTW